MKNIFNILILSFAIAAHMQAQNPEWINYTNGDNVSSVVADDNLIYAATSGGLVKIDNQSAQTSFYNHANSPIPSNQVSKLVKGNNHEIYMRVLQLTAGITKFNGTTFDTLPGNNAPGTNDVFLMYIDPLGNLWTLGFNGTLYKFDGNTWSSAPIVTWNYSFPRAMVVDSNQFIWILTEQRLLKIDPVTFSVTNYSAGNSILPSYMASNSMSIDDSNNIWIAILTPADSIYFIRFDGVTMTTYTSNIIASSSFHTAVFIDGNDTKWIGCNQGLLKFENGLWALFNTTNSSIPGNQVNIITQDDNGIFWVGTNNGLASFDGSSFVSHNTSSSGISSNQVNKTVISSDGRKWLATANNLQSFDDQQWNTYDTINSGLPGSNVNFLAIDKQDQLWMGAVGYSGVTGLSELKLTSNTWSTFGTSNSPIPSNYIYGLVADSNNIWLDFYNNYDQGFGITLFDGTNNWTTYNTSNSALLNNVTHLLAIDQQNNIWFAEGNETITKFDGVTFTNYIPIPGVYPSLNAFCGAFDNDGNLWVGTYDHGLLKFDGSTWFTYSLNYYEPEILSIAGDDSGVVWLGTNSGLMKLDNGNLTVYDVSTSGISSDYIYSIAIDKYGNKWISTGGGLSVFREGGVILTVVNPSSSPNFLTDIFPNPFQKSTSINYSLEKNSIISIEVFNILGKNVKTILKNEKQRSGNHQCAFNGTGEGIYFVKLTVDGKIFSQKIIQVN